MFSLTQLWYRRDAWHLDTVLLLPFSWLFGMCVRVRRWMYRIGLLKTYRFEVPVIVVGNITVGGTGKTPLVIEIAHFLRGMGYRPGIVSRGYGYHRHVRPFRVTPFATAQQTSDEAILLMQKSGCPVFIGVDRAATTRALLDNTHCDLVIADDGLQHYRLGRDLEIVVVDGQRRFGNQCLLPAGPLREPVQRLREVDMVIVNEGESAQELTLRLLPEHVVALKDKRQGNLEQFRGMRVHAVAAIGYPARFFVMLRAAGLNVVPHVFPDHYQYREEDFQFEDLDPILMTEKDAVKCDKIADERHWCLVAKTCVDESFMQTLLLKLKSLESCDAHLSKHSKSITDHSSSV